MSDNLLIPKGNPGSPEQRAETFLGEVAVLANKYPLVKVSTRNVLQSRLDSNHSSVLEADHPDAYAAYLKVRPQLIDLELLDEKSQQRKINELLANNPSLNGFFELFYWSDLVQAMSSNLSSREAWIAISLFTETDTYDEAFEIANFCMELFVLLDNHSVQISIDPTKFTIKREEGIIGGIGQVVAPFFSVDEFKISFTSEKS